MMHGIVRHVRPEHYNALAWDLSLAKLADVRVQNLEGEALISQLEPAWAHLFKEAGLQIRLRPSMMTT